MGSSGAQHEHAHAAFYFIFLPILFRELTRKKRRACISLLQRFRISYEFVGWLILQNYAFCVNIFIVRFIKYFTCVFVVHYHCNCVCTFCMIKERSAWDIFIITCDWKILFMTSVEGVHCTYKCQIFINKSSLWKFKKINLAECWKKEKCIY